MQSLFGVRLLVSEDNARGSSKSRARYKASLSDLWNARSSFAISPAISLRTDEEHSQ